MTWLTALVMAVILTAFAALTGIKPKGTKPVSRTRLIGMARLVFMVLVLFLVYLAFQARSGG